MLTSLGRLALGERFRYALILPFGIHVLTTANLDLNNFSSIPMNGVMFG